MRDATKQDAEAVRGVNEYWRQLDGEAIERGEHRDFIGGEWEALGRLQKDYLVAQGLEPHHRLVDVGCGALRAGLYLVPYLESGRYFGLDINASLIAAGRQELEAAGLGDREVHLLVDDSFRVDRFGERFDFALAQSVFTHLPMNLVVICLKRVGEVLAPGGRFFTTFFRAPEPAYLETIVHQPGGTHSQYHRDIFHYAAEEMEWMGRLAGLDCEVVGEWGHPRAQQMAIYQSAGG